MQTVLNYIRSQHERYLTELTQFLKIPSISTDDEHKPQVKSCAEHAANIIRAAGLENVRIHETKRHPIITAEWLKAPGKPTVLVYGHYDVQPVDPIELWEKPPFEPHIKNDRIIARGSTDDKGQVFMHFKALEALLKEHGKLPVNVKLLIEGEEEIGSPNLPEFIKSHRNELKCDVALVSDTDMWAIGIPAITYGLKGLSYIQVNMVGPNMDLHSGEYGGVIANPAEILARMIATVKDKNGRIQIPGFYDKVVDISPEEKAIMKKIPFDESEYKSRYGVEELWGEAPYTPIERGWARPTVEINGIWGGFTGEGAKTVLPSKAHAKVSMRLVPNQDPEEIATLVENYFVKNAPNYVKVTTQRFHGGKSVVVPLNNPYMKAAAESLKETFNQEAYFRRTGGSIPIVAEFKDTLGVDTLLIGFGLPDGKTHSPNENFHLPTCYQGIEALARLYVKLGS